MDCIMKLQNYTYRTQKAMTYKKCKNKIETNRGKGHDKH